MSRVNKQICNLQHNQLIKYIPNKKIIKKNDTCDYIELIFMNRSINYLPQNKKLFRFYANEDYLYKIGIILQLKITKRKAEIITKYYTVDDYFSFPEHYLKNPELIDEVIYKNNIPGGIFSLITNDSLADRLLMSSLYPRWNAPFK